jgi:periplasmic divalent cation tolerance protein
MHQLMIVFTTVANDGQANQLATAAVQANLAACVQTEMIRSTYRWQGQLEREQEIRLLFKTTRAAYPQLEALILSLHPYELPAFVALEVCEASAGFADWVTTACQPQGQGNSQCQETGP